MPDIRGGHAVGLGASMAGLIRHPHVLLARGASILEDLFPGFV